MPLLLSLYLCTTLRNLLLNSAVHAFFTVEKVPTEHWIVPNLATFIGPLCTWIPVYSKGTVKKVYKTLFPLTSSLYPWTGLLSWEPPPRSSPETHQLLPADGDGPRLPLQPGGLHA